MGSCPRVTAGSPDPAGWQSKALIGNGKEAMGIRLEMPPDAWIGGALIALLDAYEKSKMLPTLVGIHPLLDIMVEERLHHVES